MIVLLDTNVVSELIRKAPDPAVKAWAASHPLSLSDWPHGGRRRRACGIITSSLGMAADMG